MTRCILGPTAYVYTFRKQEVSGMCWPILWGFGWIFPVVGLFMCLAFMLLMFRFGGRGFMCIGGGRTHQSTDGTAGNRG